MNAYTRRKAGARLTYLAVERLAGTDAAAAGERVCAAAEELARSGTPVRYLRSIIVPEDGTTMHLFAAPSAEAVAAVGTRSRVRFERVVEAVQ